LNLEQQRGHLERMRAGRRQHHSSNATLLLDQPAALLGEHAIARQVHPFNGLPNVLQFGSCEGNAVERYV
jgi:ABC-type hemin transport system ATPase subunit